MLNIFLTIQPAAEKVGALDVKASTTWVAVKKQEGSDCGYHAIYNGIKEYIKLSTGNEIPDLPAKTLDAWRQAIIQYRKAAGRTSPAQLKGGWLDDGEVEFLIARHLNDIPLPAAQLADAKKHLTVIPNVVAFNYQKQEITKEISDLDKNNALHIFILGNMVQNKPNQQGHWIAVVVINKNRKHHYYALDSLNKNLQTYANALAQILGTDINVLQLLSNPLLANAETQLITLKKPAKAFAFLQEFIDNAQAINALGNPAFAPAKSEAIRLLKQIATSQDEGIAVQAQSLLHTLGIRDINAAAAADAGEQASESQSSSGKKKKKKKH